MNEASTTLYFKQGSSDKEYTVTLIQGGVADLWDVFYSYGRRGGPQRTCLKCDSFRYDDAKSIYDKLIHAKKLKGYTAGENAAAYADNPNAGNQTEFLPQLANDVSKDDLNRICRMNMGDIFMQTKHDGERRGVIINETEEIVATNRKGQQVSIKEEILEELKYIQDETQGTLILDTEDMGDHLMIFDVTGPLLAELTVKQRQSQMQELYGILYGMKSMHLRIDLGFWPENLDEVWAFIDKVERDNEEGAIIRIGSASYTVGKPNSLGTLLRWKFTGSATCLVIGHVVGKASVEIAVRRDLGIIPIGKVTIPPNYEVPPIGSFVEILYMNIMRGEGAKLFQPRFKGVRGDKIEADLYSTLKFKKGS